MDGSTTTQDHRFASFTSKQCISENHLPSILPNPANSWESKKDVRWNSEVCFQMCASAQLQSFWLQQIIETNTKSEIAHQQFTLIQPQTSPSHCFLESICGKLTFSSQDTVYYGFGVTFGYANQPIRIALAREQTAVNVGTTVGSEIIHKWRLSNLCTMALLTWRISSPVDQYSDCLHLSRSTSIVKRNKIAVTGGQVWYEAIRLSVCWKKLSGFVTLSRLTCTSWKLKYT